MPKTEDLSRRLVLGGLATLLSTTALATPGGLRGGTGPTLQPQPSPSSAPVPVPSGGPMRVELAFVDGTRLVAREDQGADLGTIDTGLMQQSCRRYVSP